MRKLHLLLNLSSNNSAGLEIKTIIPTMDISHLCFGFISQDKSIQISDFEWGRMSSMEKLVEVVYSLQVEVGDFNLE